MCTMHAKSYVTILSGNGEQLRLTLKINSSKTCVCVCVHMYIKKTIGLTAGSHYKSRQGKESLGSLLPISFLLRLYLSVTLWRKKAEDFGTGARSLSTHWYPVPILSLTTKSSLGPNPGTCYHRLSRFRCSVFWFQMLFSWLQSLKDFFLWTFLFLLL